MSTTLVLILKTTISISVNSCSLRLENWLIVFIDTYQLFFDVAVIRLVHVLKLVQVMENVFDLLEVFSFVPEMLFRIFEAASLNIFYFIHCVLFHFSPH
jgi:hypothetical protein